MRNATQDDVEASKLYRGEKKERVSNREERPQVRRDKLTTATFFLAAKPPFRLDLTAWAIHRRDKNHIDEWDGEHYRRLLVADGKVVLVTAKQTGGIDAPRLQVIAKSRSGTVPKRAVIMAALNRLLGLQVDLAPFYELSARDNELKRLASQFRGVKPPRFPSVFEALVNGIACQKISLTVGITLLNRLAARYGTHLSVDGVDHYGFPEPSDLAGANTSDLRTLGFSNQKAKYLVNLGRILSEGRCDIESLDGAENEAAVECLTAIPGIGRWTAEYTLLRGLGRLNVFPGDDVGAQNNLIHWLRLKGPVDYQRVSGVVEKWKTYAGLIYFHLLLSRLADSGSLFGVSRATQLH